MSLRSALTIAILAATAAAPALGGAPPNADAILRQAYDNYRSSSSEASVAMTVHRPAWERHMEMKAWTRGDRRRAGPLHRPGQGRRQRHLEARPTTPGCSIPKLNQVIKLPASMMSQSWMGSDFSYNDLSKSEDIINDYTHRLAATAEQAGGHTVWTIEVDAQARRAGGVGQGHDAGARRLCDDRARSSTTRT